MHEELFNTDISSKRSVGSPLLISFFRHCKSEGLYEMDMVVLGCQVQAIDILMYCFATLAM